jgi:hypothetical protein
MEDKIKFKIWNQVLVQVRCQFEIKVRYQVRDKVRYQVLDQVRDQADHVWYQVWNQVGYGSGL